jgi:hypothetical protein
VSVVTFNDAEVLAEVVSAVTFIVTIGVAVLGIHFIAKSIRWVRPSSYDDYRDDY